MTVVDRVLTGVPSGTVDRAALRWATSYQRWAVVADFICALAAGAIALVVRFDNLAFPYVKPYIAFTAVLPLLWVATVALAGGYEPRFFGLGSDEFRRVALAGLTLIAGIAIAAYALKTEVARGYVIVALPLATLTTLTVRYHMRKYLHRLRKRGLAMRRVVAVGHNTSVLDLIRQFRREHRHGMDIVAACLPGGGVSSEEQVDGVAVLGDFSEVALVVDAVGADTVAVLACPELDGVALRRLAWQLEKMQTDLVVAPALMDVAGPRTTIRPVAGLPLLHVEHPELTGGRQLAKTLFDRCCAALALIVLAPVMIGIAIAIRRTSHGPALFRQNRVGKDGVEFACLKFRTMVRDAELRKAALLEYNQHDGVLFKIRNDPRITPLGAWLRRYSLDELPQLINVLKGDMSLVGPRPPLPEEVGKYGIDVRRRLVVKPGMTGLWQVSGRADLSWEESVRLDLRYVENWSLMLDLQILWKTCAAVAWGNGAY